MCVGVFVCVCVRKEREEDKELMVTGDQSRPVEYDRNRYKNNSNIYHMTSHQNILTYTILM